MTQGVPVRDEPSAFFGRQEELRRLDAWWQGDGGLLTVTGPPGAGKTRLARHFAARLQGEVGWVELAGVAAPGAIVERVGRALGISLEGTADPDEGIARIGDALAAREPLLVVLDDADSGVQAVAEAVAAWRVAAPGAFLLVTCRERLRLSDERSLELQGLGGSEAVALFVDRARSARPELEPDDVIERIAERLDRLPLALELAAVRIAVLPPEHLLGRLDGVLGVLTRSFRGPAGEGRTLRAAIEASWALLERPHRAVLSQLAVFEGGFTLGAAEAVVQSDGVSVLDAVQELRERSLLRPVGESRYRPYTGVGERALEALEPSGEARVARRHLAWAASLEQADLSVLRLEVGNLEAALRRWDGSDEARSDATRVALALGRLREADGLARDRLAVYERVGEAPGRPGARLVLARADALRVLGRPDEVHALLERVADRLAGHPDLQVDRHLALAAVAFARSDVEAVGPAVERAEALAREHDLAARRARALVYEAALHQYRGDLEAAREVIERARAIAEGSGDVAVQGFVLGTQGRLYSTLGLVERARACLERKLAVDRSASGRDRLHARISLAYLHLQVGRSDEAVERLGRVRDEALRAGLLDVAASAWLNLGTALADLGRPEQAVEAWEQAIALTQRVGPPERIWIARMSRGGVLLAAGRLGEARTALCAVIDAGEASRAVLAGARAWLGVIAAKQGRSEAAARHFEAARQAARKTFGTLEEWVSTEQAHLDLLRAEQADDPDEARAHLDAARERVQAVLVPDAAGHRPVDRTVEVRGAARRVLAALPRVLCVEAWTQALDPDAEALVVDRDEHRYRLPGGEWVDLSARRLLARLLECLLDQAARDRAASVDAGRLIDAGWPGEKMLPRSASNRLHKNLSVLRGQGFKPWVETTGDGWRLDPDLRIVSVPGRIESGSG